MADTVKNPPVLKIYNLFPRLVGKIPEWEKHLDHIAEMGFNTVWIQPPFAASEKPAPHHHNDSGSCYAIKDFSRIHSLHSTGDFESDKEALKSFCAAAKARGITPMADLVMMHVAVDHPWVEGKDPQYPHSRNWFKRTAAGAIDHHRSASSGVVWSDVAPINYADPAVIQDIPKVWIKEQVDFYLECGFEAFRCDTATRVPQPVWRELMEHAHEKNPNIAWFGETVGAPWPQVTQLNGDYGHSNGWHTLMNSALYYDGKAPWFNEEQRLLNWTAPDALQLGAAETHDTPNRYAKFLGDMGKSGDLKKESLRKYAITSLFSEGTLIPIGFEYGFKTPIDVFNTTPDNYENPSMDISREIRQINDAIDFLAARHAGKWQMAKKHFLNPDSLWQSDKITLQREYEGEVETIEVDISGKSRHVPVSDAVSFSNEIVTIHHSKKLDLSLPEERPEETVANAREALARRRNEVKRQLTEKSLPHILSDAEYETAIAEYIKSGRQKVRLITKEEAAAMIQKFDIPVQPETVKVQRVMQGYQSENYYVFVNGSEKPSYVLTLARNVPGYVSGRDSGIDNFDEYQESLTRYQHYTQQMGYQTPAQQRLQDGEGFTDTTDLFGVQTQVKLSAFSTGMPYYLRDSQEIDFKVSRMGEQLAKLHLLAFSAHREYPYPLALEKWEDGVDYLKTQFINENTLGKLQNTQRPLQQSTLSLIENGYLEELEGYIDLIKDKKFQLNLPECVCHNDFHRGNILWNQQGNIQTVVDFNWSGRRPRIYDFATEIFYHHFKDGQFDMKAVGEYIAAYQKILPLSQKEIDFLPAAILETALQQNIESLRYILSQPERVTSRKDITWLHEIRQLGKMVRQGFTFPEIPKISKVDEQKVRALTKIAHEKKVTLAKHNTWSEKERMEYSKSTYNQIVDELDLNLYRFETLSTKEKKHPRVPSTKTGGNYAGY